jgi:hypothetical protein
MLMADVVGREEEISRNRGDISLYFHCDEDGPHEDNLNWPAIGHPEDEKRTCEDI